MALSPRLGGSVTTVARVTQAESSSDVVQVVQLKGPESSHLWFDQERCEFCNCIVYVTNALNTAHVNCE